MSAQDKRLIWCAVLIGIAVLLAVPPIGFTATPSDNKGGFNSMAAVIGWCVVGVLAAVASGLGTLVTFRAGTVIRQLSGLEVPVALVVAVLLCVAAIKVGLFVVIRSCPPWAGGG